MKYLKYDSDTKQMYVLNENGEKEFLGSETKVVPVQYKCVFCGIYTNYWFEGVLICRACYTQVITIDKS